jgi:hypothetical protein
VPSPPTDWRRLPSLIGELIEDGLDLRKDVALLSGILNGVDGAIDLDTRNGLVEDDAVALRILAFLLTHRVLTESAVREILVLRNSLHKDGVAILVGHDIAVLVKLGLVRIRENLDLGDIRIEDIVGGSDFVVLRNEFINPVAIVVVVDTGTAVIVLQTHGSGESGTGLVGLEILDLPDTDGKDIQTISLDILALIHAEVAISVAIEIPTGDIGTTPETDLIVRLQAVGGKLSGSDVDGQHGEGDDTGLIDGVLIILGVENLELGGVVLGLLIGTVLTGFTSYSRRSA